MTGIIHLRNGSKLPAVFLCFFISQAASKGEATVVNGLSGKIPQYFGSYSDDLNAIPATFLDAGLVQPYEIRRNSLLIQERDSIPEPRQPSKRNELIPEDVPVRTEGFLQSFLKLTPQASSRWQQSQPSIRDVAPEEERLVDNSYTLNGSKRNTKMAANDYSQSSEKKPAKVLLNKSPAGAVHLGKRLSSRNLALKRWWGGYYRPRPKMDRRASKSKHYECLKQCIGAGRLHPIQCHTLC